MVLYFLLTTKNQTEAALPQRTKQKRTDLTSRKTYKHVKLNMSKITFFDDEIDAYAPLPFWYTFLIQATVVLVPLFFAFQIASWIWGGEAVTEMIGGFIHGVIK